MICEGVDDQIMLIAVDEFYKAKLDYCSPKADPYKDDSTLGIISGSLRDELKCRVDDLHELIRGYFNQRLGKLLYQHSDCNDLFEEWLRDVASKRMVDMNTCNLRAYDHFFDLTIFADYVKNKSIPKETYTKMIISAQCKLEKAVKDYYNAFNLYEEKIDEFSKYMVNLRSTSHVDKSMNYLLVEEINNHPVHQEWVYNRFSFKIVECFLQYENLDKLINQRSKQSKPAPKHIDPKHTLPNPTAAKHSPPKHPASKDTATVRTAPKVTVPRNESKKNRQILICLFFAVIVMAMFLYKFKCNRRYQPMVSRKAVRYIRIQNKDSSNKNN
ncbi:hypothetical protein RF11_05867 [Thelohanellus kitauei]|uniref:Uncharacterized protein n=1 Tax=Thelohanellus kitauei TaxID=669202 RepID=A0A0C2MA03_THEKT|nr:hypothetical protein RF11_05867 [Thelohanellus kitauei]